MSDYIKSELDNLLESRFKFSRVDEALITKVRFFIDEYCFKLISSKTNISYPFNYRLDLIHDSIQLVPEDFFTALVLRGHVIPEVRVNDSISVTTDEGIYLWENNRLILDPN
jgi:hypothetical protein